MNKKILYLSILLGSTYSFGQNWKAVSEAEAYPTAKKEYQDKRKQKIFKLERSSLDNILKNVSNKGTSKVGTVVILPNVKGELERFEIWESSNFSAKDQAKFTNIRSYVGKSLEDSSYLRFSTGPSGISSTIYRNNDTSEFLETYSTGGDYFEIHSKNTKEAFNCTTPEVKEFLKSNSVQKTNADSTDQTFKTYRLALSVTGEYSNVFGGTVEKSLEAMNNTMTRVNGVYEKEMSINFSFVDGIEKLIYLDPDTDPYSPANKGLDDDPQYGGAPYYASAWNVELQRNLRDNFGEDNYDIGHLFGHAGGGGNAGCIGCICETDFPLGKGSGFTSPGIGLPKGDAFDIDYVAHEIGHQLGGNHTFTFRFEGTVAQVEPGSGSTIMGYAGITSYNVQNNSDDYFSRATLKQVEDNLIDKTCGITKPILNTAPKIEIEKTIYNIPVGTAFKLDSKVTDSDGDDILVNWEQNDRGNVLSSAGSSRVLGTKTTGPNFRSFKPVKETYRYFPNFKSILDDKLVVTTATTSVWESLTSVPRTYNFTVTARDNNTEGARNAYESVRVIAVTNTTPFKITEPSTETKLAINKDNFDVKWDLGNTDKAPINTSKVKISISWDGGNTFNELGTVDNTGSANFSLPEDAADVTNGYIMIEAVDNIFLAVKKFSTEKTLASKEVDTKVSNVYPNPSNGSFYIDQKSNGTINVEIVDFNGRVVYTTSYNSLGNTKKQINTNLSSGVYILKITSKEENTTSKIIIN